MTVRLRNKLSWYQRAYNDHYKLFAGMKCCSSTTPNPPVVLGAKRAPSRFRSEGEVPTMKKERVQPENTDIGRPCEYSTLLERLEI